MKTTTFKNVTFWITLSFLTACGGGSFSLESVSATDEISLSLVSSDVTWNGSKLVGSINLKAQNYRGAGVSGYVPEVTVVSTNALSQSLLGKVKTAFYSVLPASFSKSDVSAQSSVVYTVLPCLASDDQGQSSCKIEISSGTGEIYLQIAGAKAKSPIDLRLVVSPHPTATSVSPTTVASGLIKSVLTFTGTDFKSPLSITVGTIVCENVVVVSSTQATCELTTDKSLGLKDILIKNPDKQFTQLSAALEFTDSVVPTISISQKPSSLVNVTSADIVLTVQDNVTAAADLVWSCQLDGAPYSCVSSPIHLSSLADGAHNFLIQITDGSGNAATEHVNWSVDTVAPIITINNAQLGSSPSAITTARSVSFAGADVVRYKALVSRNESCGSANFSSIGEVDIATSFSLAISTAGTYNICAIGRDAAGNWQSVATMSATLTIDTSIPYIVDIAGIMSSPSNDSSARVLTLSGNSTQAYKAATLKNSTDCSTIDFNAISESSMSSTYTISFSGDGSYVVCAIGRNSANVWQTTATRSSTLVIDTVPSSISAFTLGASPSSSNTTRSIYFSGTDIVQWKAQTLATNSCDLTALNASAASPVSTAYSLVTATDGTYYVCAIGMDAAGNWQTSATVAGPLVIDTAAPALTKTTPASGTSYQGSVTVTGTCENGLTVSIAALPSSDISAPASMTCASNAYSLNITLAGADGSKSLVLSSADAAANTAAISFSLVKDTNPPALAYTSPAAATAGVNGLRIEGTCEMSLPITLAGTGLDSPTSATCVNSTFAQDIVFTAGDGNKAISISQTDSAGNVTTVSRTFVKDSTGPALILTSPAAGTTGKNGLTLVGTCEEGRSITLAGSGLASPSSTSCTTGGVFSVAIIFTGTDGTKTISLTQSDVAGNSTTISRDFVRDTVAPVFTFASSVVKDQSSNSNYVNFSGTCEVGASINVTLNSTADGTAECVESAWSYRSAIQTTDGTRSYILVSADPAGNETTLTGTWVRDATAPTLSLVSPPAAGAIFAGGASITIGWSGSDAHINNVTDFPIQLRYSSNGGSTWVALAGPLMNTGSYAWNLPSINSSNFKFQVVMTDSFGNATTVESSAFIIDSSAPIVTLTSLTGGQLIKGGVAQNITWTLSDSNPATNAISLLYSTNGGSTWQTIVSNIANSGSSGTGTYPWTPTVDGSYLIKVRAVDKGGLIGEATAPVPVVVDATPPALSNIRLNGATSGVIVAASSTITISWTTSDNNFGSYPVTLFYSVDNGANWTSIGAAVAATPSSYSWNITSLAFADGDIYRVKVVSTDRVDNMTEAMTNAFSVRSSAPALTFNTSVNTNLFSNASSVTYLGTCSNGYAITVTGPNASNPAPTCSSGTWSWTTDTVSTDAARSYTFTQSNGGLSTSISATWTRDTVAPSISSFTINGGASSTSVPTLTVQFSGTDANSAAGLRYQLVMASIVTQTCPSVGTSWTALPESGSLTRNTVITAPNGQKTFCLWIADAASNVASSSQAITFNAGTIPQIVSFSVTNGILGSNYGTNNYSVGDTVRISWSVHDNESLSTNPIYLDVTTDGINWTALENGYGNITAGSTDYAYVYTGYSAVSGFFRIRLRVRDSSGNWSYSQLSNPQNTGNWSIVAGTTERGVGGSGSAVNLGTNSYGGGMAAINPANGDIYAVDNGFGVVKISSATNLVSSYIKHSDSGNNFASSGTINSSLYTKTGDTTMVFNGGYLYLMIGNGTTASSKIYRINPADDTYTLYFGGGTNIDVGGTKTTAFIMYDAFRFDEDRALYYFTSCASPPSGFNSATHAVRLMRVAQDESGNAKTAEFVAGQCTTPAAPVSGSLASATPLGPSTGVGTSDLAVWDHGNMIYYRMASQARAYKAVNVSGTRRIYDTNLVSGGSYGGLAYSPTTGYVYFATGGVEAWNPTTTVTSETSAGMLATGAGSAAGCNMDGVNGLTDTCAAAFKLINYGDQVVFLDGSGVSRKSYRLRFVDGNNRAYTLAGSLGFLGDGGQAVLSRGQFRGLAYKNSSLNLSALPNGLYLSDPVSDALAYIDSSGVINGIWGNQTSVCSLSYSGKTMSTGLSLGCAYGAPNVSSQNIVFDANGLLWTRNSTARISQVQANKSISQKTTDTSAAQANNFMYVATSSNPGSISYFYAFASNMTMKDTSLTQDTSTARQGLFSLGGFTSTSYTYPGAVLRFADFKKSQITHIMGTSSGTGSTADIANANLSSSPLSASCVLVSDSSKSPCYTRFIENDATIDTDDELYFVEGNLLRVIVNPLNPGSQTLKTLLTEAATINNFIPTLNFSEGNNNRRIYYVMNGLLYCFALDKKSETSECKNRAAQATTMAAATVQKHSPLGPPTGMLSLTAATVHMADSMAWKDRTTLYLANGSGEIYKYSVPQPSTVTQNLTWGINIHGNVAYGGFDQARVNANYLDAAAGGARMSRFTIGLDSSTSSWNTAISRAKMIINGAKSQNMPRISIILAYDWIIAQSDKKTFKTTYDQDSEEAAIYTDIYNAIYYVVSNFKDETGIAIDWEMANEINLRNGATWNVGWNLSDWQNVTAFGSTRYWEKWMTAMKATSDAIAQVNQQYGTQFRRGLGTTSTHTGFLKLADYMGVQYEFISYHTYNVRAASPYSFAAAVPGSGVSTWNVFASLAEFKKPVSLNEINCGETYDTDPSGDGYVFDNSDPTSKLYTDCLYALKNHLNAWRNNTQLDVESILLYELRDEPQNHEPENRFGMFWTNSDYTVYTPKPQYYIMKSIMGVSLTTAEENVLKAYPLLWPIKVDP